MRRQDKRSLSMLPPIEQLSWFLFKSRNPVGIQNQTVKSFQFTTCEKQGVVTRECRIFKSWPECCGSDLASGKEQPNIL